MIEQISRRHFVKLAAGSTAALGVALWKFPEFEHLMAASLKEIPVIWFQGAGCNGCSVSVLNTFPTTIYDVLLSEVVSGNHISLRYHPTVMASQGDLARKAL